MENNFQITDVKELAEVVRRLRALSRRYQDFFQLQFQRLGEHMKAQQQMLDRADAVRSMLDDIQGQKDHWESQRLAEMQQIDEASRKLLLAWQALEEQQRAALAQPSQLPRTQNTGYVADAGTGTTHSPQSHAAANNTTHCNIPLTGFGAPNQHADFATAAAQVQRPMDPGGITQNPMPNGHHPPAHPTQPNGPPTPVGGPVQRVEESEPVDPEIAKFEYEQLKRQMRAHANRQS